MGWVSTYICSSCVVQRNFSKGKLWMCQLFNVRFLKHATSFYNSTYSVFDLVRVPRTPMNLCNCRERKMSCSYFHHLLEEKLFTGTESLCFTVTSYRHSLGEGSCNLYRRQNGVWLVTGIGLFQVGRTCYMLTLFIGTRRRTTTGANFDDL